MSDEDWDEPEVNPQPQEPVQGRIFGGRGRGFRPADASKPQTKYVEKRENFSPQPRLDDSCGWIEDTNVTLHNDSHLRPKQKQGGFKSNKSRQKYGDGNSYGYSEKTEKPKRQDYIPEDISDERDLFSNGISSGINFNKYDDAEVKVSGENIPKKITRFEDAGLCSRIMANIRKSSYTKPTPIQKYGLPIVMSDRDLMACAQTGSGKTVSILLAIIQMDVTGLPFGVAAFLVPIVNNLMEDKYLENQVCGMATPQVLIVTPTRELAIQIYIEARKFTFGSSLKTEICYGGTAVRYQKDNVKAGCNLLIGTPGRLAMFLRQHVFDLSGIRYFVFDEADRMLDMSFLPEVEQFLNHESRNKNNDARILMFSATFPEDVQALAKKYLKDYIFVAVGIVGGACTDVEQRFYSISKFEKRNKLIELLEERNRGKTLVFVEKKRTADIIAAFLSEKDLPATSMHGDREQVLREEALKDFKTGRMDILVATAVAARGLDIKDVAQVINFDLPKSVDEYVHRIGRTGRVGNRGLATSFFDPQQDSSLAPDLVRILSQAGQKIPDFLQQYANNCPFSGSTSSFGGRDIRKYAEQDDDDNEKILQVADMYEEEVW